MPNRIERWDSSLALESQRSGRAHSIQARASSRLVLDSATDQIEWPCLIEAAPSCEIGRGLAFSASVTESPIIFSSTRAAAMSE